MSDWHAQLMDVQLNKERYVTIYKGECGEEFEVEGHSQTYMAFSCDKCNCIHGFYATSITYGLGFDEGIL